MIPVLLRSSILAGHRNILLLSAPKTLSSALSSRQKSLFTKPLLKENGSTVCKQLVRSSSSGNHAPLWTAERVVSASLIVVLPAAFMTPSPFLDCVLSAALTAHIHWGMEGIAVDYVRERLYGPIVPKMAVGAVYALSIATLGGLFYFNMTDVGLTQCIRMFWSL